MANTYQYGDLIYQDIKLISPKTMKTLYINPIAVGKVLAKTQFIPVTVGEFHHVCAFFPIVFSPLEQAMPMAIMSFTPGKNPFVDEDKWAWNRNMYMPMALQRYPFALLRHGEEKKHFLCIDVAATTRTATRYPLFNAEGEKGDLITTSLQRCKQYADNIAVTEKAVAAIGEAGLLVERQLSVPSPHNGQQRKTSPFKVIDKEKFAKLSDEQLLTLHKCQAIWLIHCHIISMERIQAIATVS